MLHTTSPAPSPVLVLCSLGQQQQSKTAADTPAAQTLAGSLLFVVSGVAGEIQSVAVLPSPPPGLRSLFAGLIGWPDVIAANLFFFPAGILQVSSQAAQCTAMRVGGKGCTIARDCVYEMSQVGIPTCLISYLCRQC